MPGLQGAQPVAPEALWNLPAIQFKQDDACDKFWYVPAVQFEHITAWIVLANLPDVQTVHAVCAEKEDCPTKHDKHIAALVAPTAVAYFPPVHKKQ